MSALALTPVREVAGRPSPRRDHLQLVGPGFVPAAPERPAPAPAARPAVRLTARGRLVRSVLVLTASVGLAVAGGSWLGGAVAGTESYTGPVERVSVGAGDTLWAIAASTASEGRDVRDVVDDILELNGLPSGDLLVGQQLVVPAG